MNTNQISKSITQMLQLLKIAPLNNLSTLKHNELTTDAHHLNSMTSLISNHSLTNSSFIKQQASSLRYATVVGET
jgi:hypothetical protein